jgi:hypothetical protein
MGKEKLLPLLALLILILGSISSMYVYATTSTSEQITIKNATYTIDQLFLLGKQKTLIINEETYTGVALNDLIINLGSLQPEQHQYTIIGADGYQKTVTWENLQNGVLTKERSSIFSDLPKAFRVKDITSIEVN